PAGLRVTLSRPSRYRHTAARSNAAVYPMVVSTVSITKPGPASRLSPAAIMSKALAIPSPREPTRKPEPTRGMRDVAFTRPRKRDGLHHAKQFAGHGPNNALATRWPLPFA